MVISARAVRLGLGLRRIRNELGWSLTQAAEEVSLTKATISRYEKGELLPPPATVRSMLVGYGIMDKPRLTPWLQLAREAAREEDNWWVIYQDVLPEQYLHYVALEAGANTISVADSIVVPGLLQTPEYARELMRTSAFQFSAGAIEQRVQVRRQRQARLTADDAPIVRVVVAEAVLRGPADADVMRAQCDYLRAVTELPNVTLQIFPWPKMISYGPVALFTYDDIKQTFASVDTPVGDIVFHRDSEVEAVRQYFDGLVAIARPEDETVAVLENVLSSLR